MSGKTTETVCARRDFLRAMGRSALLAALAVAGAVLALNSRRPGKSCQRSFRCGRCSISETCSLPQAVQFRTNPVEVKS
jgi:hypothetical protein